MWVDNEPPIMGIIGGENYQLYIDRIRFASRSGTAELTGNNYIGYMQNFIYEDQDLFSQLKNRPTSVKWIFDSTFENLPPLIYKPITLTSDDTFFQLPSMTMGRTLKILFQFKTRESNGLILYNGGPGSDAIAIELSDGLVRLVYNMGAGPVNIVVPTPR